MKKDKLGPKNNQTLPQPIKMTRINTKLQNEEIKRPKEKSESSDNTDESEIISHMQNMSIPHVHRIDEDRMQLQ